MALKAKMKNRRVGTSTVMTIPVALEMGDHTSLAANRIMLADVRGILAPEELLEFLENEVEPRFWPWLEKKKQKGHKAGSNAR